MTYTSFPMYLTTNQFVDFWKQYLSESPDDQMNLSVYIHYPWCKSICQYCVFGSELECLNKDYIQRYSRAVLSAVKKLFRMLEDIDIIPRDIYFGGGTASRWSAETLRELQHLIPQWDQIPSKQIECHPSDITDDLMKLYANDLKMTRISFGVQSFDHKSCIDQHRIPTDKNVLTKAIQYLQDHNVLTNVDLVYMFNGDDYINKSLFMQDLTYTAYKIQPDSIYVSPNFRSKDFYQIAGELRYILEDYVSMNHKYRINDPGSLSHDLNDIISYADIPYVISKQNIPVPYESLDQFIDFKSHEVVIGIGGINSNVALSHTPDRYNMSCMYTPSTRDFIFTTDRESNDGSRPVSNIYDTEIRVGRYTIPSYNTTHPMRGEYL